MCFQMACYYAKRHPEASVLAMDFAEEGDLTKRLLGGAGASDANVQNLFGGVFRLLADAQSKTSGLTSWLWSSKVDITKHAVRVNDINKAVPANLYLVSSGAWPREDEPMASPERRRLASNIRESLEASSQTWKVFCDTDGDRRPSALTLLAYNLCPQAIVPLHLNRADLDRTETMLGLTHLLREEGEIETQVLCIVWNFVKSMKDEPCTYQSSLGDVELSFTPTKVSMDILSECNMRLCRIAKDLPGLFVHEAAAGEAEFVASSTTVLRQLADNVLKPSEELGLPFVEMMDRLESSGKKSMRFKSGQVEYDAKGDTIIAVDCSVRALSERFEAMVVSGK